MSISTAKEGDVMGRGIPVTPEQRAAIEAARQRDPETVAILGAGPAGLLAAHAVALAGRQPVIFSRADRFGTIQKSPIAGATYLHTAIPDLTSADPDGVIRFVKVGTREGYAFKLYGSRFAPCSWDKFSEGPHPAWALQPAYDDLWKRYHSCLIPADITADMVRDLVDTFPLVISTIPPQSYCENPAHTFPSRAIWITSRAGPLAGHYDDPVIVYDGRIGLPSYRSSRIFGTESSEWTVQVPESFEGKKPQPTSCDCFAGEVMRAGRWGCWQPGILVHHAFEKVWKALFDQFEGA